MRALLRSIACAALVVAFSPASPGFATTARTWHVSAAGSGDACTSTHPCGILSAFTQAQGGDTILIGPGDYGSAAAPLTQTLGDGTRNLTIKGLGRVKPTIYTAPEFQGLYLGGGSPSSVSWLRFIYSGDGTGPGVIFGGTADRLDVIALSGNACQFSGTMTNSVCWGRQGSGLYENGDSTLVNDDFLSDQACAIYVFAYNNNPVINVRNTIASGDGCDLKSESGDGTSTATFNVDHSQYLHEDGVIFNNTNDVVSAPSFVDRVHGDLREAAGAASIDRGDTAHRQGASDLAGNPRVLGRAVDIGAYEHPLPPTVSPVKVTHRGEGSITASVTVNPRGLRTSVELVAARHDYSIVLNPKSAGAGRSGKRLSLSLTDLARHAKYRVYVVATSVGGSAASRATAATTR